MRKKKTNIIFRLCENYLSFSAYVKTTYHFPLM